MKFSAKIGKVHVFTPGKTLHDMTKYLKIDRTMLSFVSIEDLLNHIVSIDHIDCIPDHISFNCDELEDRKIPIKDITSILQLAADLSCNRLGGKNKKLLFAGTVTNPISSSFANELNEANFVGVGPSIRNAGFEESSLYWKTLFSRNEGTWPRELISKFDNHVERKSTLEIKLTYRQQQVLHMIRDRGLTNKQIAKEFGISEQAVKLHVSLIMKKYGVKNRTQLALFSNKEKTDKAAIRSLSGV